MDTIHVNSGATRMVAHRGVSGLETENTCAAFVAAGNRSYYGVETDVHVTADGQYVIIHDDRTGRVAGEDLSVEGSEAEKLFALRLLDKDGGEKTRTDLVIPRLSEYIRICRKYEKECVLELKNTMEPVHIAGIIENIRKEGWLEHVIFISFSYENMKAVRELLPEARVQYLITEAKEDLPEKILPYRMDIDILWTAVTRELVDKIHAMGREINVWTVDDPEAAERLAGWGVDYITSNICE